MDTKRLDDNTWRLTDGGRNSYLIEGENSTLLVDGFNGCNESFLSHFTEKSVSLINTSASYETTGANDNFPSFYMSPSDAFIYYKNFSRVGIVKGVYNGTVIDLGKRKIEVISFPGVTPGAVVLLDYNTGSVFSGLSVKDGVINLSSSFSDIHAYLLSIRNLAMYRDKFDVIYPGTGDPLSEYILGKIENLAERIIRKDIGGEKKDNGILYTEGLISILTEAEDDKR